MTSPGHAAHKVNEVLLGEKLMTSVELDAEIEPDKYPFGSVPSAPGGRGLTLIVNKMPAN